MLSLGSANQPPLTTFQKPNCGRKTMAAVMPQAAHARTRPMATSCGASGNTSRGNGDGSAAVVGFANFFLETTYSGTSGPICAIYIGPASLNGSSSGRTDSTKVYMNVLYK